MTALIAFRYIVGDYHARKLAERSVDTLLSEGCWRLVLNYRGLRLLARSDGSGAEPFILPDGQGLVAGILFERHRVERARVKAVDANTVKHWCASEGRALVRDCWGPYLAILNDAERDRVLIVRDPLGARACYFAEMPGVHVMFTHVADWAKLNAVRIDDAYLAMFLRHPRIEGARTALTGIAEAIPGVVYRWERAHVAQTIAWAPTPAVGSDTIFDFDQARDAVRTAVEVTAKAWARAGLPIVHRLSGGFDSSVALASLVKTGAENLICVNERPIDVPEGDEFAEASAMAAHVGVRVEGILFDPTQSDYAAVALAPASAKPSPADMSFASTALASTLRDHPFFALTSGQGGDQVFSRRPLLDGAADAIRDRRALGEVWRIAWEAAHLARKPLTRIAHETWAGLVQTQGRRIGDLLNSHAGTTDQAGRAALDYQLAHPWLHDINHRGPARAYRALNLLDLAYYQRSVSGARGGVAAPIFASQPVVETILRIPPYLMQRGGRDRALARAAFADLLPPSTLARTRKGDTTRHFQRVLENNLSYLRAFLPEGELVRRGILDVGALHADLERPEGRALFRLTAALVAESWIARINSLPPPLIELPAMHASA